MSFSDFANNFHDSFPVPELLKALFNYANHVGTFFSGYFELTEDGADSVYYWFGENRAASSKFAIFGQGGDGSLYGFWLYENGAPERAPIVFLGSEGVDNLVLANNMEDFLVLLGLGINELGYAAAAGNLQKCVDPDEELQQFRQWLQEKFALIIPEDGQLILQNAQAAHPDLEAWINAQFSGE